MARTRGDRSWQIVTALTAVVSTLAAKKVVDFVWVSAAGKRPPENPEDEETNWKEAAAFAAVTGVVAGVARLALTRAAARKWAKAEAELS